MAPCDPPSRWQQRKALPRWRWSSFAAAELAAGLGIGCATNAVFVGLEDRLAELLPFHLFLLARDRILPLLFGIANGVRNLRPCRLATAVAVKVRILAVPGLVASRQ